jgi:excinuclease ABC subunit A
MFNEILVKKARNHNLKNISVTLPKNKLIVFTGVSGSGKSTLAFDTIYAEGQRRYVESLSSYARQFLGIMPKPDVDSITGLSPAIAIDQKSTTHNPRSTVGTVTEIYDYIRLLFARIGKAHCPSCGLAIQNMDKSQIVHTIFEELRKASDEILGSKTIRYMILSPLVRGRKGEYTHLIANIRAKGYTSVRIDGSFVSVNEDIFLLKNNKHFIDALITRITIDKKTFKEKAKAENLRISLERGIEQALYLSNGLLYLTKILDSSFNFPEKPNKTEDKLYSENMTCPNCNIALDPLEPRLFSFNSPHGACPECKGLGHILQIDTNAVLNPRLSITEGALLPYSKQFVNDTWYTRVVKTAAVSIGIDPQKPLEICSPDQLRLLLYGTGNTVYTVHGKNRFGADTSIHETFSGIITDLEKKYAETNSEYVRYEIEKYMRKKICPLCKGTRLKNDALTVTISDKNIHEVALFPIHAAIEFFSSIPMLSSISEKEKIIASPIVKEIINRLSFLESVGLDYLTLSRDATTLAGGEAQRIRLASQIGSGLSGVLYVLDEPSIGLHPRDNSKLIQTLKALRDLGNTVLVVEHDREMIESADYIVDFGPSGGKDGGQIIASGSLADILSSPVSLTAHYLKKLKKITKSAFSKQTTKHTLTLTGASEHNLKNLTVSIPLQKLVCVTGVSGSGKSTLIVETLFPAIKKELNPYSKTNPGTFNSICGVEFIKYVHLIDQSPIGRTPRSNPVTYVNAFTYIRQLFAKTKEARKRGFTQGTFSFNVKGGRCESCEGQGEEKIEMQFLPPVWVQCDICNGARYNASTLEVTYKNKTISEVLTMTIAEACSFFSSFSPLYQKLTVLNQVGLGYLKLGQPAPTLSGGEAQRVKLASELSKQGSKNNVYILDEPTTGLHFADLEKLLAVLEQLVQAGNTVIVIEHNLDIIKNADYVIDLGPEGGENGGYIIAEGTPRELSQKPESYTGSFLKSVL